MELKISYALASSLITVIAFSGAAGTFFLMVLSDYVGRKTVLVIINAFITVGIVLIIIAGERALFLMIVTSLFGLFYGAIFPMYGACARDYFPKEITGSVLGNWTILYGIGMMAAPVIGGHLADITHTFRWPFGLAALATFSAAILVGAADFNKYT